MDVMSEVPVAAVVAVALIAVAFDVRTRRIPNRLTLGAAGAALIYAAVTDGFSGVASAGGGWVVGVLLFFPFFALRGMGAGDVKLLGALGAWLGPAGAFWVAIFASIAGGVLAVAVALAHGYLGQALRNVWLMLMQWRIGGFRPVTGLTLADTQSPRLAYAIPITVGVLCTLWK